MQKPKIYSYLALHDGAIEKMLLHGTTATNTELKAEQGFDEHLTQRALYGSSVHARSVPEQGFDELQTTSTELKAEQGFDELRRTTSKAHHQRMLYMPHCQTLAIHGEHPAASQAQWKIVREAVPQPCRDLWFTGKLIVADSGCAMRQASRVEGNHS